MNPDDKAAAPGPRDSQHGARAGLAFARESTAFDKASELTAEQFEGVERAAGERLRAGLESLRTPGGVELPTSVRVLGIVISPGDERRLNAALGRCPARIPAWVQRVHWGISEALADGFEYWLWCCDDGSTLSTSELFRR